MESRAGASVEADEGAIGGGEGHAVLGAHARHPGDLVAMLVDVDGGGTADQQALT